MSDNIWTFTVPGTPAPWTVWPRRGPPPTGYLNMQSWQAQIMAHAIQFWRAPGGPGKPIEGPVRLRMWFYLPLPKTAPKTDRGRGRWMARNYPKRSDVRNMAKACEDALQGIVFVNDSQVIVAGPDIKDYTVDIEGYTIITVEALM